MVFGQRLARWLNIVCTLAFFSSEMIFSGKLQSEDAVTPRGSLIALRSGYSSVLSCLLQKTVHLENKTHSSLLTVIFKLEFPLLF